MKGNVVDIHKVFDGSEKKLVIPVYQRNYDWTIKNCERLFDDIEELISQNRPKHFFGAVVGNPEDSFTWVVIDGQQRMTTVSLLMLALIHAVEAEEIEAGDPELAGKLMRSYLQFPDNTEQKFKLKPVKDDRDSYSKLFGPADQFNEKSKITVNYRYFRERLRKTPYTAAELWNRGISNLEVMLLDLEAHDDPQRIFESLNSTGLSLKESDKIRNFALMGLSHYEQNQVYEKYWNEMEKNVAFQTDSFIRWYLVAQTARTPKESDVFEAFKDFAKKSGRNPIDTARELHEFSILANKLENAKTGYREIDQRLARANMVLGDVVKPFIWLAYRDVEAKKIRPDDFADLIAIIETYIFRRVVSSVPANALNKIFANAYQELQKLRKNGERYSDVLTYMLQNRGQSGRIPDDAEFKEAFKTRDFYRMRPGYRTYFFDLVERGTSKDIADIAARLEGNDISIEHIMPQTLSKKWRDELGSEADSIHTTWVNRAANLTITGYNSEYSNLPFEKKLTMSGGFKDSPYFLNAFVKDQDEWGLQQLEARSELLANRAMELWPYPTTTFEPMKETVPFEPMGTDTVFTNRDVVAVEIEGTKTPASTWANAMVIVLRALLELDREAVLKMANETRLLTSEDVAETVASNRGWRQVDPALAVLVGASTAARIGLLRKICEKVGYDPYDIVFYLRPEQETSQKSGASVPIEDSPYSDLIELIPLISEVEGTQLSQTETLELQNNLSEAVSNHVIEEPQAVIGGKDLGTFLSMHESGDISADQALACLTIYQTMANMMGPKIWHDAMLDGDVSKLLTALTKSK